MDLRLELIPLPSRDVDVSRAFYVDRVGFHLDHDIEPGNGMRIVQLTPPGSSCSVVIGVGMGDPGAAPVTGLHLVVDDIEAARAELSGRGVDVSGVDDMGGVKYAYFSDPDGNSWALQEIPGRRGRRFDHADLTGARFEHVDLTGARFRSVDLTGAEFRSVDLKHVQMRGVEIGHVVITGEVLDVTINGVDVAPLVEAELDRRDPDRPKMRPTTPAGFREAWDVVERRWEQTVERARRLPPELLHESVDGEWSFIETLRHLAFATDAWVRRCILGDPAPWHPLDLPWDQMPDTPGHATGPGGTARPRRGPRPAARPDGHRARARRRPHRRVARGRHHAGRRARLASAAELPGARVPAHRAQRGVGAPQLRRARPRGARGAGRHALMRSRSKLVTSTRSRAGGSRGLAGPVTLVLVVVALLGLLALAGRLPLVVLAAYGVLSLLSFWMYGADKAAAQRGDRRVSESTLHLTDLLGGWPGGLIARHAYRHKTRKQPFRTVFWCTVVVNLAVLASLLVVGTGWLSTLLG